MVNFLAPRTAIWKIWGLIIALVLVVLVLGNWLQLEGVILPAMAIFVWLPFKIFQALLGSAVGRFGDYYGFPSPSTFGYLLIIIWDLFITYLIAALIQLLQSRKRNSNN